MTEFWDSITSAQPDPSLRLVIGTGVVALVLIGFRPLWRMTRQVVTIAHEGAHGLIAALVGRKLAGIRLHSDTSGVTVSRGHPTGPGMIAVLLAGYPGPALFGLAAAFVLSRGYAVAMLWGLLVALLILLLDPQSLRPLVGRCLRRPCLRHLLVGFTVGPVRIRLPAHLVPAAGRASRRTRVAALTPLRART